MDVPDDSVYHTACRFLCDNHMRFFPHVCLKMYSKINTDKAKNPTSNHLITPKHTNHTKLYKCKIQLSTCLWYHYSWGSLVCSTRQLWLIIHNGLYLYLYKNIHIMMHISRIPLLQLNFLILKLPISHAAKVPPSSKFQKRWRFGCHV